MSLTVIFLIITIVCSYLALERSPSLLHNWAMNPSIIKKRGEYYRFLLSGFIHADWGHLFFNMFSLYFVGEGIEGYFKAVFGNLTGQIYFAGLYLLGIIVADLPSYFKNVTNSSYNSIGASGGVTALVFSFVLLAPLSKIYVYFFPMPAIVFGVLYMVYTIYQDRRGMGRVNHSAHLWGAIFGLVYTAIVFPSAVPNFFEQILSVF